MINNNFRPDFCLTQHMPPSNPYRIYYRNIRRVVQKDIRAAQARVLVSVSWFTDEHLFQELAEAAEKRSVRVELILMDDDINRNSGLQWPLLEAAGVELWFYPEGNDTMHLKMCLLDDTILHTGSYNWTRKAAARNKESLLRLEVDEPTALEYAAEFEAIKALCYRKYAPKNQPPVQPADNSTGLPGVAGSVWSLRLRIQLLEQEIASLETEKNTIGAQLEAFERRLRQLLSTWMLRRLKLERQLAEIKAALTRKKQDEMAYEERRTHFEEFKRKIADDLRNPIADIPANEAADMKRLYREAVLMAHPDLFRHDPAKEAEANKIMAELAGAFRKKDYRRVQEIHEALKNGTAFRMDWQTVRDISLLQQLVEKLTLRRDALQQEINQIQSSESWITLRANPDVDLYAETLRIQIVHNIQILENEISRYQA